MDTLGARDGGPLLYASLKLLHILGMTAWFAANLFAPGDARRSVASGKDLDGLRDRLRRGSVVGGIGAFVTVTTGFGLIAILGGFGKVPHAIHAGLLLALVAWAIAGVGVGGVVRTLDAAIASGASADVLQGHVKRLAIMSGIFQAVWLLTLITMVYRSLV